MLAGSEADSILLEACKVGDVKNATWALDQGVDPCVRGKYAKTALHLTAMHGHDTLVRILATRKADLQAVDMGQKTALFHAVREGHAKAIKVLVAHQANVHEIDKASNSLLHVCCREGHQVDVMQVAP